MKIVTMSAAILATSFLTGTATAGDYSQGVQFGRERNAAQQYFDHQQDLHSVNRSQRIVTDRNFSAPRKRHYPKQKSVSHRETQPAHVQSRSGPATASDLARYRHGSETSLYVIKNPVHLHDWRDFARYYETIPGAIPAHKLSSDPRVRKQQQKANYKAYGCSFWHTGPCLVERRIGKMVMRPYPQGGRGSKIMMLKRHDGTIMSLGPHAVVCDFNLLKKALTGQCSNRRLVGDS